MRELDELYHDLCETAGYFQDAIRESGEIIEEASEALARELTEQKYHFQTALAAIWIVKKSLEAKSAATGAQTPMTAEGDILSHLL